MSKLICYRKSIFNIFVTIFRLKLRQQIATTTPTHKTKKKSFSNAMLKSVINSVSRLENYFKFSLNLYLFSGFLSYKPVRNVNWQLKSKVRPKVMKKVLCSTQLSIKIHLLINNQNSVNRLMAFDFIQCLNCHLHC